MDINIIKAEKRTRRHIRIRARVNGTATCPRLLVFRSITRNYASLIDDKAGKTLVSSHDMKEKKGTKTEKAKLVGMELAKKALEKGITSCVFDRNGYKYHGRVKALAEGAREGGLKF